MATKCGFCKTPLEDGQVFEVCETCGIGVWGKKMFVAIKSNMSKAKIKGDLYQGSVGA